MKRLKEISWNVDEPTYRADPALSYSALQKYERLGGFPSIPRLFDKIESPSLTFGSAVDAIITGGDEEFNSRFMVADIPELTDTMLALANRLYAQCCSIYSNVDDIPDAGIKNVADECNYGRTWKVSTVADKIREACSEYYRIKFLAGDKTILSSKVFEDVLSCVRALRESPATKDIFLQTDPFDDGVEYLYQLKFKANLNGVDYRCMMDMLKVDYRNKIIYPFDLKTSGHLEYEFFKSFVEWRYDLQARLYPRVLKAVLAQDEYFKDFKVDVFRFVVVNKTTLNPLVWRFRDTYTSGPLNYGKNIQLRDPEVIGQELNNYLKIQPIVPVGVDLTGDNDIIDWINKNY